jgi:hypothetical protein
MAFHTRLADDWICLRIPLPADLQRQPCSPPTRILSFPRLCSIQWTGTASSGRTSYLSHMRVRGRLALSSTRLPRSDPRRTAPHSSRLLQPRALGTRRRRVRITQEHIRAQRPVENRGIRLRGALLSELSPHALPFALSPVHAQAPAASFALSDTATCADTPFVSAWSRSRPMKPRTASRHLIL